MYTTKNGITKELTPALWRGIYKRALSKFDGSPALFEACWYKYYDEILPGTDDPKDIDNVMDWLNQIAAEFVNDSSSEFYIYG